MTADCLVKLRSVWAEYVAGFADSSWFDVAIVVPMLALALAVVVAPFAQIAYSRRVQRLMNFREVAPPPLAWWQRGRAAASAAAADAHDPPLAECVRLRERRIRHASLAAWAVLAVGGAAAIPLMTDTGAGDVIVMLLFVAVMGAGPVLVNMRPSGSKALLLVVATGVVAAAMIVEPDPDLETLLIAVALVAVIYLTCVHRTMRALVLPLVVLCTGAMLGLSVSGLAMAPAQCITDGAWHNTDWLLAGVSIAATVLAFCASMWLAARALDALASAINRGWLSDVSAVAAAGMLVVAALVVVAMDHPAATPGVKAAFLLGWAAAVAGAYILVLRRLPCPRKGRCLLMLRVFSTDRRAERLLDTLQARWQLAGPVLEIGGPDLVKLNLDINEFIKFATFRLHELFQPAAVPSDVLAASLQLGLDREGRFRVNELFCFDTSWKAVVEQLMGIADVVLLDLRGFNAQRSGTAHEVERLALRGLLPRVVALGDARTDWAAFEHRAAPADGTPPAPLALRVDSVAEAGLEQCLARLIELADPAPPPGTGLSR